VRIGAYSRLLAVSVAGVVPMCFCGGVVAAQTASLAASFSPEHLGAPTTVSIGFRISSIPPATASPLTNITMFLPSEIGFAVSELGLENCLLSSLEEQGPQGCSSNARMGRGTATAEIPIEGEPVVESAQIEVFSAPVLEGRLALFVYANAGSPVAAQLVFPATVTPAHSARAFHSCRVCLVPLTWRSLASA
jgi:hypothetical protein